jgi:hypothetical protein
MANYQFDTRGLPPGFDKAKYEEAVKRLLVDHLSIPAGDTTTIAAITGIVLLGEYYDIRSSAFREAVRSGRDELDRPVPRYSTEEKFRGAPAKDIVAELKKYNNAEVKAGLDKVEGKEYRMAFKSVQTDTLAKLYTKTTKPTVESIFDRLTDKAAAAKYKAAKFGDLDKTLKGMPAEDLAEFIESTTDAETTGILQKAGRPELDEVLAEVDPTKVIEVLKVASGESSEVSSKEVYRKIENILTAGGKVPFYQEFATVGRFVISRAKEIPFDHPLFERQVDLGRNQYVSGGPAFDSLDLPPLTGEDGADMEIVADNIKAVSMIYASYQLDVGMRMIDVVDRINEIFHNGQLPIGFDAAGKALDNYNWNAEDRLSSAARRTHYSRVLGSPGGDVSKEVQPNTNFDSLFIRFLSSLAEYERQQRVADLVANTRPQNLASEYVRKAGRDLAANLSLYGWAATQFAARRLRQHIEEALGILNQPSVQNAYGATNLYQVIERVCSAEFNMTPNIVKSRTMAEAGKQLIDLVAKYHYVWNRSNGSPVFDEPNAPGEISGSDKISFFTLTQQWLAVNGIKDAQVDQYSEPEVAQYAPSIPSFGGFNGAPVGGGTSPDQMERIRQMVTSGQMPSLDQLQGMFNAGGAKVGV